MHRSLFLERAFARAKTLSRGVGIDDESDQVPEGHMVNALALRGDEGRGTLRYVTRSCEQALIREFPNGGTHLR